MGSLNAILAVATGALDADQGALNTTTDNVANANTPGYSRQVTNLVESVPLEIGNLTLGTGVSIQGISGIRDAILQIRIQQETQQQGDLNSYVAAVQQAQVNFTSTTADIGSEISSFFASLAQLSTSPTSIPARQAVLSAAQSIATTFNQVADNLQQQRDSLDLNISQSVQQVNTLTSQIASVNTQISTLQNTGRDASAFIDQRDQLIGQLSGLIGVNQIQTEKGGITLTTGNGTPLVTGGQSFALATQTNVSGFQDIYAGTNDITSQVTSGSLGGSITARDRTLPELLTNLDTLAAGLANELNTANEAGFDLNGTAGGAIFVPPAASGAGAAANLTVSITDPSLIAASSDGTAGSNGNVANLAAVATNTTISGQTPSDYYAGIVFNIGNDVSNSTAELSSSQLTLNQLQDQRGSISGVDLNEEAANIVQYQQAYDAAARIVTTISDLMQTVIQMGT